MPTLPATPTPKQVSSFGIVDPVYRSRMDQGYEIRRSRYSRNWRRYQLEYQIDTDELHTLTDFIERETRGGALSFDWTYPYGSSVASINTGTPNTLTTDYNHGLQTGDQVVIAGSSSHDGTYTVTRTGAKTVTLDGTGGGSSDMAGTASLYFPFMVFVFAQDTMPEPELNFSYGPARDNEALMTVRWVIEERFA